MNADIHTVPVFPDEPVHEESEHCWCDPELYFVDEITGVKCWSHRRPN